MGMAQKAESGQGIMGFNPPYGYRIKDKDLDVVGEEAEVVRSIFSAYLAGRSMKDIAGELNRAEIMTRRGKEWTVWSISHLLHNPAYAGFRRWDGFLVPSTHPAIVSVDTFNAVQRRIAEEIKDHRHRRIVELPRSDDQGRAPSISY